MDSGYSGYESVSEFRAQVLLLLGLREVLQVQRYGPPPYRGPGCIRPPMPGPTPGPGRVVTAWLVHSIPTREPNLEPRRDTMCFRM